MVEPAWPVNVGRPAEALGFGSWRDIALLAPGYLKILGLAGTTTQQSVSSRPDVDIEVTARLRHHVSVPSGPHS